MATSLITVYASSPLLAATNSAETNARLHGSAQKIVTGTPASAPARPTRRLTAPAAGARRSSTSSPNEMVVVTGNRNVARKVTDNIAPIDVITSQTLLSTGMPDLGSALINVNPAINMQDHQTDQGALSSSIRMRGLDPDQVLILIDGKRRHTTANINSDKGPDSGETPVDIDMIPVAMIDHIEVLRDGAAAQYGSDAIAGVVNIILKKGPKGGSEQGLVGANYAGDGFTYLLRGDHGFKWGSDGFVRMAFEFKHNDLTSHDLVDSRTGRKDFHQLGEPDQTRENFAINWGKPILHDKAYFYGNVIYGHRHAESPQFFRTATQTPLPSYYPWGFDPVDTSEENDFAATVGVKGDDFLGFGWDLSSTYGEDIFNINQTNSANLSYLATYGYTPTNFHLRGLTSTQWTNNLDFKRSIPVGHLMAGPINVAFGAEHRMESYRMSAGDPASYYGAGSQALVGLSPTNAGIWYRDVYAGYLDVDMQPIKHLDVDIAGRFEHYTDAGDAKTGKIAARYDFTPQFAIRGAISTGFRAPTLAEEHYATLGVAPTYAGGQLAVNSAAARQLGAVPLTPEYSTNASGGVVIRPIKNFNITADVYQINIRDRIVNGGTYSGEQAVNAIEASGIQVPSSIAASAVTASYYSNGASTRTQGLDIVSNYHLDMKKNGVLDLNLGIDLNRTTLTHLGNDTNGNPLLNAQRISYLTSNTPRSKIIMGAHWKRDKFDVMLQEMRWGQTKDMMTYQSGPYAYSSTHFFQFINPPVWTTNIEFGYQVLPRVHLAVGANNLTNRMPKKLPMDGRYYNAEAYDVYASQIGFNGGYYYFRVNATY
ncbi:hypothetical protein HK28_11885 [Acetobacter sp. DsW_063]|nr:hypothetical protein HK28_11885 [Acetobacter sp. DsW_063]